MKTAGFAASITMILAGGAGLANAATPASFATRANAACAAAGAKIVALPVANGGTVLSDLRSNRTIVTKLVSELKAIKAPASKAKAYAAFVASTKEEETLLGETLTAFYANQTSKLDALAGVGETVGKRSDVEAKALGLPACAKNYTPSAMSTTGTTATTTKLTAASSTPAPPPPVAPTTPAVTPASSTAGSTASGGSTAAAGSTGTSTTAPAGGTTVVAGNSHSTVTQGSNNTMVNVQDVN